MAQLKISFKNGYNKITSKKFFTYYIIKNQTSNYFLLILAMFAITMLITNMNKQAQKTGVLFAMIIVVIGLVVYTPAMVSISVRTQLKRDYKRRGDTIEQVEFTRDKIFRHELTSNSKVTHNWLQIEKVIETNDSFYIFVGTEEAFLVDKQGLIEGTIEELRSLINNSLKKNKKGKVPYIIKDKNYKELLKLQKKEAKHVTK